MKKLYKTNELITQVNRFNNLIFVPTMGNLHAGHLSLIKKAKEFGGSIIVSIFINRLQFNPNEDFDQYPRTLFEDIEKLQSTQAVDFLFIPDEKNFYPEPQVYKIYPPADLSDILEGFYRPGFFIGVCTVLFKFISLIRPKTLILGKKDYQQFFIIRNMCRQFSLPMNIISSETIREKDGLAFSSRNQFLSKTERKEACYLFSTLQLGKKMITEQKTSDFNAVEEEMSFLLQKRGWTIDYITIRKKNNLNKPNEDTQDLSTLLILGAARLGNIRLIDNLEFE